MGEQSPVDVQHVRGAHRRDGLCPCVGGVLRQGIVRRDVHAPTVLDGDMQPVSIVVLRDVWTGINDALALQCL